MMTTEATTFKLGNFNIRIWTIEGQDDDEDVAVDGTLTVMTRFGDGQDEAYTPEQLINYLTRSIKAGQVVEPRLMMIVAAYLAHNAAFTRENYAEDDNVPTAH